MEDLIAIHVAEEARHISFAHEYLHRRVPRLPWFTRFCLSLYVPVVMRMLGQAMVVPPRRFFRQFDIPRLGAQGVVFRCTGIARKRCATCSAISECCATTWG